MAKNIQVLIETMVRCGGNCSGCAVDAIERSDSSSIDFFTLSQRFKKVSQYLNSIDIQSVESVSIFLGQGDHFLLTREELNHLIVLCQHLVPEQYKNKTVLFLTASALSKHAVLREKMDLLHERATQQGLSLFIQTVFDPKKIDIRGSFKKVYIDNILYFKQKCGMTELTINLGQDVLNHMSASQFHEWVKLYGFKHVEMNWVLNPSTASMWHASSRSMLKWLTEWLTLVKEQPLYEVNFMPFLKRHLAQSQRPLLDMKEAIEQSLKENIYIDSAGYIMVSQMGPISNLTPYRSRQGNKQAQDSDHEPQSSLLNIDNLAHGRQLLTAVERQADLVSKSIMRSLMRRSSCLECPYQSFCSLSGSTMWFDYTHAPHTQQKCPWDIKEFIEHIDKLNMSAGSSTKFDKNPVPVLALKSLGNEIHTYFEDKFL